MKFLIVTLLLASSLNALAKPCVKGKPLFLQNVSCDQDSCQTITGMTVDENVEPLTPKTLWTGRFQNELRKNHEYWVVRCSQMNMKFPCVDGDYCVDRNDTIVGFPQYDH